jgi:hypothetical protein
MWRKIDDIAARFSQAAYSLMGAAGRDAQIVSALRRVLLRELRHADAHDYRANESMKEYKRGRQNV